ncbi:MAG TPA: TetR/AcrR family transcriptional regulator [Chryseosolibacter sp.]|nr:TetR/AcrR family transcriptional regulator [Chryseosolibacter sp.]
MRNPEQTRDKILKKAGILFNTKGYKATSISDITDATGFTKGAIYRHFDNKEELEREGLFYLSGIMFTEVRERVKAELTAGNKLRAMLRFFESYITAPVVKGGCPLLNAAIEADDAHPQLRKTAVRILDILSQSLITIIENGIRYNQLKPDTDKQYFATLIIASLEGAIMMSKLRGNNDDIRIVIKHLEKQIETIEV